MFAGLFGGLVVVLVVESIGDDHRLTQQPSRIVRAGRPRFERVVIFFKIFVLRVTLVQFPATTASEPGSTLGSATPRSLVALGRHLGGFLEY